VIFINQIREKIGVFFGNPETTPGGRALKFYSSVRIDLRRLQTIKKGDEILGNHVRATIVKNKVAPPFKKAEFDIIYSEGISRAGSALNVAEKFGVVNRSGSWYLYEDQKLGQGSENARLFLSENKKILEKIERQVREAAKKQA
jgi:recombination protein RecA